MTHYSQNGILCQLYRYKKQFPANTNTRGRAVTERMRLRDITLGACLGLLFFPAAWFVLLSMKTVAEWVQ